jgi:uncharacterized protein YlxP (DUF503 family)
MITGIFSFEIYIPHAHSLKEKRKITNMIKDKIKKFNVSIAEIDFLNLWQRSKFGIAMISNDKKIIDRTFIQIKDTIEKNIGFELLNIEQIYE